MRNESETEGVTKTKRQWTPPRGIRLFQIPYRQEKPYAVQWRENQGGQRVPRTRFFATKEAQIEFAKERAREVQQFGAETPRLDPDEAREWRAFVAEVGTDVRLNDVLACWRRFGSQVAATGPTIAEKIEDYLAIRAEEKSLGADAACHARKHLQRFAERFGSKRFAEPSIQELREWVFGRLKNGRRIGVLTDNEGKPLGPHSIKDHRKSVSAFFSYAVREQWGIDANPFEAIKAPRIDEGDPTVIPLRSAFEYFKANRDQPVIGRVALEAFAAVRYTTAANIELAAINFEARGIRMAARIHKSGKKDGKARYRQGHPDNLWAWLGHASGACWALSARNYREAKRAANIRAGLRPLEVQTKEDRAIVDSLRNVWRHSFISYHLARFSDPGLTQRLAQHSNYQQTEEYEGIADAVDAARYFMITPETVLLTWEEFMALPIPTLTAAQAPQQKSAA